MRIFLIIFFVQGCALSLSQQRIENERKFLVEGSSVENLVDKIDKILQPESSLVMDGSFKVRKSVERFTDSYFDTKDDDVLRNNLSLRYRQRVMDNHQEKDLVQLKWYDPEHSELQVERKFNCPVTHKKNDVYARHPFLSKVDRGEREYLAYELARYDLEPEKLRVVCRLSQVRTRWYISDAHGDLLTISFDQLMTRSIPYHSITELEVEINEQRYTRTDENNKQELRDVQMKFVEGLTRHIPNLQVDQRSKYHKIRERMDQSLPSSIWHFGVWGLYGFILLLGAIKLVRT